MSGIVDSLRRGADRAAFEARRLTRIQRTQAQLAGVQAQIDEQHRMLGEIVWEMHQAHEVGEPRLLEICREIATLRQEVTSLEAQIEAIRQEEPPEPPKCPQCGRELSEDDAFCSGCGASVAATTSPSAPAPVATCPQCGRPVRVGAAFCGKCGARLPA